MTEATISCRRCREGLTEYLDDALSPRRRQGMERHLGRCQECRKALAQIRTILRAGRAIPAERMPAAAKRRLLRMLGEGGGPGSEGSDEAPPHGGDETVAERAGRAEAGD